MAGIFPASAQAIDIKAILHDPEAPTAGDPAGDVTIVAFLDYNCPFCKKSTPDLERIIETDGHIRLVYKDWPILGETSVYGAQLALAANFQGRYGHAHHALMTMSGGRNSKERMFQAVKASGVDMERVNSDLASKGDVIGALLKRNLAQADSLGLEGTPVYLIGPFRLSMLDYDGFKQVVSDARAKRAGG